VKEELPDPSVRKTSDDDTPEATHRCPRALPHLESKLLLALIPRTPICTLSSTTLVAQRDLNDKVGPTLLDAAINVLPESSALTELSASTDTQ